VFLLALCCRPAEALWKIRLNAPRTCCLASETQLGSAPQLSADGADLFVVAADAYLTCINATDGALRWRYLADSGALPSRNESNLPTPVLSPDGASVYLVSSSDQRLHAVSSADGTLQWAYHTGGNAATPVASIDGSRVFVSSSSGGVGASASAYLHAVDSKSGLRLWRFSARGAAASLDAARPALSGNGAVVFIVAGAYLQAVNATDGALVWEHEDGAAGVLSMPTAIANFVMVGITAKDGTSDIRGRYAEAQVLNWGVAVQGGDLKYELGGLNGVIQSGTGVLSPFITSSLDQEHWRMYGSRRLDTKFDALYCARLKGDSGDRSATGGKTEWLWPAVAIQIPSESSLDDKTSLTAAPPPPPPPLTAAPPPPPPPDATEKQLYRALPALSGDGGTLYLGSTSHVFAVSADTGLLQRYFATGGQVASTPAVSKDGGVVYVSSEGGDLFAISACADDEQGGARALRACDSSNCTAGNEAGWYADGADDAQCSPCATGFFRNVAKKGVVEGCGACPVGTDSAGGAGATACMQCATSDWCLGGGVCYPGRSGTGCAECAGGYAASSNGTCVRCPDNTWLLALPVVLVFIVLLRVIKKLRSATEGAVKQLLFENDKQAVQVRAAFKTVKNTALLMNQVASLLTTLTFLQTASALVRMDFNVRCVLAPSHPCRSLPTSRPPITAHGTLSFVPPRPCQWPLEVRWFSEILGFVSQIDLINAAAPSCFVTTESLSSHSRWVLTMCAPFLLLGILGAFSVAMCFPALLCRSLGSNRLAKLRAKADGVATGLFLLTYILMASQAASPFDCIAAPDGKLYMREAPGIECTYIVIDSTPCVGGSTNCHSGYLIPGIIVLFSCVAAIFIIFKILRSKSAQLHSDELTLRTYGTLYLRYENDMYFWEIWILARKLSIVLIQRMLQAHTEAQIVCAAVVLIVALVLQHRFKPFISTSLDQLEECALASCTLLVILGAYSFSGGPQAETTALYCVVIALTFARVAQLLRRIWAGEIVQHSESGRANAVQVQGQGMKILV
jgi:outer membrane protein assembly factor BamB